MSSQYLQVAKGDSVKLGGADLPGIITRIRVEGELDLERKPLEDTSGSTKLPHGFRDATVIVSISILPPNPEAQLKAIEAAFKKGAGVNKITPYRVVHPHLDARGITSVVFKRLTSEEGGDDDQLLVEVTLVEYEPAVVNSEKLTPPTIAGPAAGVGAGAAAAGGGGAAPAPTPPVLQGIADGSNAASGFFGGN